MIAANAVPSPPDQTRAEGCGLSNNLRTINEIIRFHAEIRPKQAAIVGSDFPAISYQMLQDEIAQLEGMATA